MVNDTPTKYHFRSSLPPQSGKESKTSTISGSTNTIIKNKYEPNEVFFDSDSGTYVCMNSGLVLLPEELPETKGETLKVIKVTPPTIDEFYNHLLEEMAEGLYRARNNDWAQITKYPVMEVGQTAPFMEGEVPLEHYQVGSKVVKIRGVNNEGNLVSKKDYVNNTVIHDTGVEFDLVDQFRNHYTKNKRSPDCVSIEGKETPDLQTEEVPDLTGFFEAMFTLIRRARENPTGNWLKYIPDLVNFLVDGISIPLPGFCESREIGISEILSTFGDFECQNAVLEEQNRSLSSQIKNLVKDKKHLRSQIYGHNKHDKLHMK